LLTYYHHYYYYHHHYHHYIIFSFIATISLSKVLQINKPSQFPLLGVEDRRRSIMY